MSNLIKKKKVLKKGAEANLYLGTWFGNDVIFKHRIPKKYRTEELDRQIRSFRTVNEARALIKVKEYGINVPKVYEIDTVNSIIVMSYIKGDKVKDVLESLNTSNKKRIFIETGRFIGKLHRNGQIHGDITTSNVILTGNNEVFLIDFGLHEYSDSIEDKSVDLHLFKRVLMSSHGENYTFCFKNFLNGYKSEFNVKNKQECEAIIGNIDVIESRGRYVKKEDRL